MNLRFNDATSSDLESARLFHDRPLNILDLFLIEKYDGIPRRLEDYLGTIGHPDFAEDFYKYMMGVSQKEAQKIEDLLIQDNILYALDKSDLYREKYMKYLNINNSEGLQSWVKSNIKTGEDLELLPSFTNEDIRRQGLNHSAWWIPGKRIANTYQTGGSTGKPSIIPYSPIDKVVVGLVLGSTLKKIDIKNGDKILFLAPGDPHLMAPHAAYAFERMGIATIPYWKHFKNPSSQEIISTIGELKPDIVFAAPHGPKGATAALDILIATDQQNGTDILPNCLEGKTILSGGAPMARELIEELYDTIKVASIVNGYGSAQTGGFLGKKMNREHNEGDPDFSSDIEITPGYWIVNAISDTEAPSPWSRFGITVLGREVMPIIKYDPGDYGQVNLTERIIDKICRIEWFYKDTKTGKYSVKIPSQVGTCISGV